ncbi:MAG: hypothetical protein RQ756_08975, partial [Flavobacteriaceae bacterium]|nr:hypothetical protein [Flavobacteriaceae bacterium]
MKNFRISAILYCLGFFYGFSQNLETSYSNYFELPREQVFLHLNKTKFVTGETLWFKAYVTDQKYGILNPLTKNLYVGIYDEDGVELQKQLWYVEDGMTHGQLEITKEFLTGEYYIKASTNYMKNFGPEQNYLQKISVINLSEEVKWSYKTSSSTNNAVLNILPEGGAFVLNTLNSVGVKLTDTLGYGYAEVRLSVKNQTGDIITETVTNRFGHARFDIQPNPGDSFQVIAEDLATEGLTNFKTNGITMRVNALLNQQVIVELNTNTSTINRIKDKKYQLLVHRDGLVFKIPVVFGAEELKKTIQIPRSMLLPGVNILTLFNEQEQPILERMLFNQTDKLSTEDFLQVEYLGKNMDSMAVALKYNTDEIWHLSASFLPSETDAYKPEHNIYSALLLKPYLKGFIENAPYYFQNASDRKTKLDLDLLLLTQGWSSYDWYSIQQGIKPFKFNFEQGLSLRGKVYVDENVRRLKKYEVLI